MAEDIDDLRSRVAAARDRLNHDVDFAQKVELRLNDLARIVEGSLARQSAELEAAQSRIATLDEDLARALARAEQAAGDASKVDRFTKENGELRSMVMTLLEVIEGRQKSSLASVMQKLEGNISSLVAAPTAVATIEIAPETLAEMPPVVPPETEDVVEAEPAAESWEEPLGVPAEAEIELELEEAGPTAEPPSSEEEVELEMDPIEEPATDEAMPADEIAPEETETGETGTEETGETAPMEDLSEIALYDASEEVVEPGKP